MSEGTVRGWAGVCQKLGTMVNLSFLLCFSEGVAKYKISQPPAVREAENQLESYLPSESNSRGSPAASIRVGHIINNIME